MTEDERLDALDHHAGWCSCAARGWIETPVEGLDAMRYARAFYEVTKRRIPLLPSWDAISADHMETIKKDAAEVAAEYARLGDESCTHEPGCACSVCGFPDRRHGERRR